MNIALNFKTIKQLFVIACVFAILTYASFNKLTAHYTKDGIIYDGYFGHKVVGTKNKKSLQQQWIKAVPIESKRFTIRKGTTAMINASNDPSGDGIFYVADTINLPDSLTEIHANVFTNTKGLRKITIPNSVNYIGVHNFAYCTDLVTITLSDNLTKIPDFCFYACTSLARIAIPENVNTIGCSAFEGCGKLVQVKIPNSVHNIRSKAFAGCTSLKKVYVSNDTEIASDAFPPSTKIIARRPSASRQ